MLFLMFKFVYNMIIILWLMLLTIWLITNTIQIQDMYSSVEWLLNQTKAMLPILS